MWGSVLSDSGNGGNGGAYARLLLPILISLVIGGVSVTETYKRAAGITERQLLVATTLERQQQVLTDLTRRIEEIEVDAVTDDRSMDEHISAIQREIALMNLKHDNLGTATKRDTELLKSNIDRLLSDENDFEKILAEIEDRIDLLEYKLERSRPEVSGESF